MEVLMQTFGLLLSLLLFAGSTFCGSSAMTVHAAAPQKPSSQPCDAARLKMLERDAAGGSAAARRKLADIYAEGRCVRRDYAQAAALYKRSAQQGDADSQFQLGMYLVEGKEVPLDPAKAATWFQRAADQNHVGAQYALGSLYLQGRGVPKDLVQGYKWIRISGSKTDRHTNDILATVAKLMSSGQIKNAESQAESWLGSHPRALRRGTDTRR
jgi:TPR repeat protein